MLMLIKVSAAADRCRFNLATQRAVSRRPVFCHRIALRDAGITQKLTFVAYLKTAFNAAINRCRIELPLLINILRHHRCPRSTGSDAA